jgi:GT2 family glycosyltransferase
MSTIDVIIPCYRYGHYLRACVESVLAQEGVEARVLVIDDESPDNTPEVGGQLASEDARVTFRRHVKNQGHIATYNEGIAWVESKYFLLLSADDYLQPGALARAAALMDADDRISFCYGNSLELDEKMQFRQAAVGMPGGQDAADHTMAGAEFIALCRRAGTNNTVPTPTAVVRTSLQKRLDGYRPELPHTGDLELWLRLAAHGRVGFVAANQAVYRRHSANMSLAYGGDNRLADLRQRQEAVEWFCDSCSAVLPDAAATRRSLLEPIAREAAQCASGALNDGRPDLADRFSDFATQIHPGIMRTAPGLAVAVKRRLDRRVARVLTHTVGALRRTAGRIFG